MPIQCHVLPFATADGPSNMALDESMLEAARDGWAYLRFYKWSVPTLSLGYFQRIADARSAARWQGTPIVRRPTGGGAIWHDRELTYAIAIPPDSPLVRPNTRLYRAVHEAIAGALAEQGIPARLRGDGAPRRPAEGVDALLCFTGRDPEDIVSEDRKLVGSSQRRRGGAVLQHGSILLRRSSLVPELPGVCDLVEESDSPEEWRGRLEDPIVAALGMEKLAVDWPEPLLRRADELDRSRYRLASWTEAR